MTNVMYSLLHLFNIKYISVIRMLVTIVPRADDSRAHIACTWHLLNHTQQSIKVTLIQISKFAY